MSVNNTQKPRTQSSIYMAMGCLDFKVQLLCLNFHIQSILQATDLGHDLKKTFTSCAQRSPTALYCETTHVATQSSQLEKVHFRTWTLL